MSRATFPEAVLFDLDGTLLDSAPDMLAAVNALRAARGRADAAGRAASARIARRPRDGAACGFRHSTPQRARVACAGLPRAIPQRELASHGGLFEAAIEAMLRDAGSRADRLGHRHQQTRVPGEPSPLPMLGWDTRCAC